MGLKKYEIITVGSDKRVRALRSWAVGGRYVNIGDVGGIVYDEKTLSQDGACWLFRGNFGFPGARIGGDSIVDVAEVALSTTGTPAVDIVGSSVVVGSKLQFKSDQTAEDIVVLTAADFEQGGYGAIISGKPLSLFDTTQYVRPKNLFFAGGKTVTLKCEVPGYSITAIAVDRDGLIITNAPTTSSGAGVTITVPAGQYFTFRMSKDPTAAITPAEAGSAQITFTGTYETKLSIIDSRVEVNPATSTGVTIIKPGGSYPIVSGAKYPEAVIRNSKVSLSVSNTQVRVCRIMGQIIGSTATLDATASDITVAGQYSNIKNLMASGVLTSSTGVSAYNIIQSTDCNDFAVSPAIFPGLAAALTANMPFIFQGCNVPNGVFYHHAQIANTYRNIDFAKAQTDLGKSITSGGILVSSEVEGMYRIYFAVFGALVESYDSVKSLNMAALGSSYGTTIYKDAYFNGLFDIAGTNVFGHKVRSHPLAQVLNVQPRVVQGNLNSVIVGNTVTGVVPDNRYCVIPIPLRVNGSNGITVQGLPGNLKTLALFVTPTGLIKATDVITSAPLPANRLPETLAYIRFGNADNTSPVTPEDLAGVTVTVYNGCKIVNTGATAVNMKGSIRVEDNATLFNASVTGTGYFGGNAVMSGMTVNGYAYMKDNTLCTKTSEITQVFASLVMEGNAVYNSIASLALTNLKVFMYDNSKILGDIKTSSPTVVMRDNATITAAGSLAGACGGVVTIKDNAVINTSINTIGDITLCGDYVSTSNKIWTGKRVIDDHNAPEYDNNVKTQYDF